MLNLSVYMDCLLVVRTLQLQQQHPWPCPAEHCSSPVHTIVNTNQLHNYDKTKSNKEMKDLEPKEQVKKF